MVVKVEVYILQYSIINVDLFAMLEDMTWSCFYPAPSQHDLEIVREILYRPAPKNPPTKSLSLNCILHYESLLLLRDGGLLNDEVLEAFFKLLEAKYSASIKEYVIFDTRLYAKLTTKKTYDFDLIKTYVHIWWTAAVVLRTKSYAAAGLRRKHRSMLAKLCMFLFTTMKTIGFWLQSTWPTYRKWQLQYTILSTRQRAKFFVILFCWPRIFYTKKVNRLNMLSQSCAYVLEGAPPSQTITHKLGVPKVLQHNAYDCGVWILVFLNLLLQGQTDQIKDLSPNFLTTFLSRNDMREF